MNFFASGVGLAAGQLFGTPVPPNQAGHPRLRVLAYDITEARRAARVRRLLRRWAAGDGQFSVCEVQLGAADLHALLDAVHSRLDVVCDRLALWQPARQLAWRLQSGTDVPRAARWPAYRLWVVAYDITDPARLRRIQRCVAAHCVAMQRSVYALHGSAESARALTLALVDHMQDRDRLTIWPLQSPAQLWSSQTTLPACLPLGSAQSHLFQFTNNRNQRETADE